MPERSFGFFGFFGFLDEIPQQRVGSSSRIRRADVERLLTDDTHRRVRRTRVAAVEWAGTEVASKVEITAERLVITPYGLLYNARLSGSLSAAFRPPAQRPASEPADPAEHPMSVRVTLHYLATPLPFLDPVADRLGVAQLPPDSRAAVDSRFGRDLEFPWPLDAALRRTLAAHEVLLVGR